MSPTPLRNADGDIVYNADGQIIYLPSNVCWGEESPTEGEDPQSWQLWEISDGVAAGVSGDASWGKLRVLDPVYGPVVDTGDATSKQLTLERDKYGTGWGGCTLYIRGSDTIFDQHDASPSWAEYTAAVDQAWRYVQVKVENSM